MPSFAIYPSSPRPHHHFLPPPSSPLLCPRIGRAENLEKELRRTNAACTIRVLMDAFGCVYSTARHSRSRLPSCARNYDGGGSTFFCTTIRHRRRHHWPKREFKVLNPASASEWTNTPESRFFLDVYYQLNFHLKHSLQLRFSEESRPQACIQMLPSNVAAVVINFLGSGQKRKSPLIL